jgi:hypothetical protein
MSLDSPNDKQIKKYATLSSFPTTGCINLFYYAIDTRLIYTWNGSAYVTSSNSYVETNRLRYIEFDANGDPLESGFLLDANDSNDEAVYLTEEI